MRIPLAQPDITNSDRKAVLEVLKTPYLSLGPKLKEFEKEIAEFIGVKYAIGVSSGTSALHLIIRALGIKKEDEVITSPFSFIASANCILYEGAKPVFADIDNETLNINPKEVEKKITKKTKAILVPDIFGLSADWGKLIKIAKKYRLKLIEDSTEALGAEYLSNVKCFTLPNFQGKFGRARMSNVKNKWQKCGSFGDAAVFSFYPNKQIAAGEGAIILTKNKKISELCWSMANQGRRFKNGKWLDHIRLGYNYRLDEMSAVLALSQLKRIREILAKREKAAQLYNQKLKNFPAVEVLKNPSNAKRSWFVYVILLSEKYSKKDRDKIVKTMGKRGIQCNNYFQSIHLQPIYRKMFGYKPADFPVCESVSQRTIALPFYNNLKRKEIDFVVKNLKEIIQDFQ